MHTKEDVIKLPQGNRIERRERVENMSVNETF